MADTPKTREEWLRALHFAPPDHETRPASPQTTGDAGEERLLHALDHMRAIMIEVGSDGRPVFVSPTITTILGYSAEEIAGTPGWDFVHEEDRSQLLEMSRALRASGQPVSSVLRARHKSGHWVWIEATTTRFQTQEGDSGTVTLARDVTAMKEAGEALRASEERFRALSRNSSDLILELDHEGTIRFVSENGEEILGAEGRKLLSQSIGKAPSIHPEDATALAQGFGRFVDADRRTGARELRIRHGDGTWHWFDARVTAYRNHQGDWRALVIARDVTESRRAERELRNSEERYRVIAETSGELISELDSEGRLIYTSPAIEQVLGYAPTEVVGTTPAVTIHPDDVERCVDAFLEFMRSGELMRLSAFRVRGRDGSWHWLETDGIRFQRADGEQRFLAVSRDRTEQIRAAGERRSLERRIEQTQRLEGLGVMAGGIAHDFNNLLTPILGDAGLALMDLPEDSPARPRILKIQKAARRAAALTGQMLAYAGKEPLLEEPVDLSSLVREMAHLLGSSVARKAAVVLELDESLPAVRGDTAQLTQVVMNLLTNAAEAMGEAGGSIRIRTGVVEPDASPGVHRIGEELPPGPVVMVEVEDDGCGMDSATRARIFDPFYSTKFTGRGLGLAAALGIVRAHGGAIDIETGPGQGTRFRVLFPSAGPVPTPRREPPSDIRSWRSDALVLVVDDDEGVRDLTRATLERAGLTVLCAPDAATGLALFRQRCDEIALVVLDRTLPTSSGVDTFETLHEIQPGCRIVLMSGYSKERAMAPLLDRGLSGFLQKPFLPEQLLEAARSALDS